MDLITLLDKEISETEHLISDIVLSDFVSKIFEESDFSQLEHFYNETVNFDWSCNRSIIFKFARLFSTVTYFRIPVLALLFKEAYVLDNKDIDSISQDILSPEVFADINFQLFLYEWNNKQINALKHYIMIVNLYWLIYSKWWNIFFHIDSSQHKLFFDTLSIYLVDKYFNQINKKLYLWYSPRIIFGSSIYTDILEYKYKNFNSWIENYRIFKIMHVIYNKHKDLDESDLREILKWEISNDSHISSVYQSDFHLNRFMHLLKNPYQGISSQFSEVLDFTEIPQESKMNEDLSNKSYDDVFSLLAWKNIDIELYVAYYIFFKRSNAIKYINNPSFQKKFYTIHDLISFFLWIQSSDESYKKRKIIINNLNFLEQISSNEHKISKYEDTFLKISQAF